MRGALIFILFCFTGLVFFVFACPPGDANENKPISQIIPAGWPKPQYNFENNKLSLAGFELGRKLFYDPRLSRNNTISCASCHQPFAAFAHIEHNVSHGIDNKMGKRNAPALFNLNWHSSFFWDGGVNHLEVQPLNPMTNPVEMDQSLEDLIPKLQQDDQYRGMFKTVFKTDEITSQRVFKALAQFMGMLVSYNSKYDKYMRKEPGGEMSAEELNGLAVFKQKCETCHKEPLFSDFSFRNNGLQPKYGSGDSGRATITKKEEDLGKFKVPSLRNLKYTAPYMHDGRFDELYQVLDHYTGSKYDAPNVDQAIKFVYMTAQQKQDLLSFLNTLNDEEFVKDPRFRDPENKQDASNQHHILKKQ